MLVEPGQTNFDLRFRLFGMPVRVHPFFWLFSAILGWPVINEPDGFLLLIIWVVCCFLSILLHEFGHVWMGAVLGSRDSYIVLYSFGGLAVGSRELPHRWQRILVSLAGPGLQLALYGLFWFCLRSLSPETFLRLPGRGLFLIGELLTSISFGPSSTCCPCGRSTAAWWPATSRPPSRPEAACSSRSASP